MDNFKRIIGVNELFQDASHPTKKSVKQLQKFMAKASQQYQKKTKLWCGVKKTEWEKPQHDSAHRVFFDIPSSTLIEYCVSEMKYKRSEPLKKVKWVK